jgi:hypothetical protein
MTMSRSAEVWERPREEGFLMTERFLGHSVAKIEEEFFRPKGLSYSSE